MDRVYYHFPQEVDFERRYGFNGDMSFIIKVMASMHGKSGHMEFDTEGPNVKRNVDKVKAKRDLVVDITDRKLDFIPLTPQNVSTVLSNLPERGTVDFRITVRYTYFDKNFDKMSLVNDIFLVRTTLNGDLTLQVVNTHGQGRTLPEEIANTIETQMETFNG